MGCGSISRDPATQKILGSIVTEIAHVGSTSVDTIMAKPIIDIALAVPDFTDIIGYNRKLELHGFYYRYAMDAQNNILRGKLISKPKIFGSFYMFAGDIIMV